MVDAKRRQRAGEQADAFAAASVRRLRRFPPRGATHVLVGPPLVYDHEEDTLSFIVVRGTPGGDYRIIGVDLGRLVADALDDPFAAFFDTVMQITRSGEITMREGRARRAAFIRAATRGGVLVEDCATERDLMEGLERLFPGARARTLRAEFDAEQVAA